MAFLKSADRRQLREIIELATEGVHDGAAREALADPITRIMRAEFFASFVWNGDAARYDHRVAVNMDPHNLERYERYFQFHDPVTPVMSQYRRAMIVDDVINRHELERTEFYQDFLARDGLHHGINFFAQRDGVHIGDLRVWRLGGSPPFGESDRMLLDIVGAIFVAHAPVPHVGTPPQIPRHLDELLTSREREVALAVLNGLDDGQIGLRLRISYGTVRTHLGHVFEKWGVRNRLAMISACQPPAGDVTQGPRAEGVMAAGRRVA